MNQNNFSERNPFDLIGNPSIGLLYNSGYYDIDRYPWAYQAWKRQQQIHWLGEEVPLSSDLKDWQNLPKGELNLLTEIFRFFTQSDVEVSNNYLKHYLPLFQPLELQMMMAAFSNMETVHIDAYALLLKTLGMEKNEFRAFREYESMQAKVDYMHTFGTKTCKDVARTLAMFGAFTEGMALFSSFAMLLNFPRHNKMKGMGQIISWSVRDESLHCESMIRLFHSWGAETNSIDQGVKNDIKEVANTMVLLEDEFIEIAFALGEIEGLKPNDIKQYIRYICDWRLTQLHLEPLFGFFSLNNSDGSYQQLKVHPIPWLLNILNGVEHANFFEIRATEYSKVATQGVWSGSESAWERFKSSPIPVVD